MIISSVAMSWVLASSNTGSGNVNEHGFSESHNTYQELRIFKPFDSVISLLENKHEEVIRYIHKYLYARL